MSAGKQHFFIVILMLSCFFLSRKTLLAQYAPAPPNPNSTAIHLSDTSISFWANEIEVQRAWKNIADTTLGKASAGLAENALGKANAKIVSLGDGGSAILQFPFPIYNVNGYDFAVFENGFSPHNSNENEFFLELAFVEVSQDGNHFVRFDAQSAIDTTTQKGSFEATDCTQIHHLAGKYPLNYGTPFDLEELGLDSITHIKIIDVVGSIDTRYASYDVNGNKINDPYPTAFASSGFDLNAIGAINQVQKTTSTTIFSTTENSFQWQIFPNPLQSNSNLNVLLSSNENKNIQITIVDLNGRLVYNKKYTKNHLIAPKLLKAGIYFISLTCNDKVYTKKLLVY